MGKLRQSAARGGKLLQRRSSLAYLKTIDIFQDLTHQEIEAIHRFFPMRECRSGTVFFHWGDADQRLYILKEGRVVLYRLAEDGRRLVMGTVYPGTIFGEMALAGLKMRDCYAEAQEDSLVCQASRKDLEALLARRPEVAFRLLEVFGRRILALEEQLQQIAQREVRARLIHLLLGWAERDGGQALVRGYTQADMADAIGAARQTVSLELKRLERSGYLTVRRKLIVVKQPQELARLAAPGS